MKLLHLLAIATFCIASTRGATRPNDFADREAIIDTALTFYRSLDEKSESLLRSTTTKDLIFDGTLFAEIGLGAPDPLVGQNVIAPSLIAALSMTTMHNLANFRVEVEANHANVTAYVLAYHYKELEQPRENPWNNYLMGNKFEGRVVKEKGIWKLGMVKISPFFQSGNIVVMGLNDTVGR